jgi:hypothetical protein
LLGAWAALFCLITNNNVLALETPRRIVKWTLILVLASFLGRSYRLLVLFYVQPGPYARARARREGTIGDWSVSSVPTTCRCIAESVRPCIAAVQRSFKALFANESPTHAGLRAIFIWISDASGQQDGPQHWYRFSQRLQS